MSNHEPVASEFRPPTDADTRAIRRVGVIGGGTAGYLTALALRATRPWLDVTLVESRDIPIIGVGEATVPSIVRFLHQMLDIDPAEFYQRVRPSWKLGIKFEWGPDPAGFMAPFDWGSHSIGMLGALASNGTINGFSLESLMMTKDRTPVINVNDRPVSLLKYLLFAYHLDNSRFVGYLTELAGRRGVQHIDATIGQVIRNGNGWVDHLRTTDGRDLQYDFYVDCTGFRSLLLGGALKVPFESYSNSLFTDSAVVASCEHAGNIRPYTIATTMDAGWCWTIPVPENDHLGYVYSSIAISDEKAAAELRNKFPGVTEPKQIHFRSGRYRQAWYGNVMAIGNSYAFVEPLESTALAMMTKTICMFVASLPSTWSQPTARDVVNECLARRWDGIRWFLSLHYKFNTRLNTPFWAEARSTVDVSGFQPVLDSFATGAPLARRHRLIKQQIQDSIPPGIGLCDIDNILLGQQVQAQLLQAAEPADSWRARRRAAEALIRNALPLREALAALVDRPELLTELFGDNDSWAGPVMGALTGISPGLSYPGIE
jgi:tryptophan halogenase